MKPEELEEIRKTLDERGCIDQGPFVSFRLIALIWAMQKSGWDYPAAMSKIGQILGVKEWENYRIWPMHPPAIGIYAHLEILCPKADWRKAPPADRWCT